MYCNVLHHTFCCPVHRLLRPAVYVVCTSIFLPGDSFDWWAVIVLLISRLSATGRMPSHLAGLNQAGDPGSYRTDERLTEFIEHVVVLQNNDALRCSGFCCRGMAFPGRGTLR